MCNQCHVHSCTRGGKCDRAETDLRSEPSTRILCSGRLEAEDDESEPRGVAALLFGVWNEFLLLEAASGEETPRGWDRCGEDDEEGEEKNSGRCWRAVGDDETMLLAEEETGTPRTLWVR